MTRALVCCALLLLPAQVEAQRPAALPSLYVASVSLQAFDGVSTLLAIDRGAREANPFMRAITTQPATFIALKAATATSIILASEQLWKRGRKKSAIVLMIASNAALGFVASRNVRVLSELAR